MILTILLLILLVIDIFAFVFFIFFSYEYAIVFFAIGSLIYFIFLFWYVKRCRLYLLKNIYQKNISNLFEKTNENWIIEFKNKSGMFSDKTNSLSFNLKGFLFKKSFIRAFVVRALRYKTISKKMKIFNLFRIKLKSYEFNTNKIILVIENRKYIIYKKGYTYNSFISALISKSIYSDKFLFFKVFVNNNNVESLNERKYLRIDDYYYRKKHKKEYNMFL